VAGAGLVEERAACTHVADRKADDAVVADPAGGLVAERPDIADAAVGNVERDGEAVGASPGICRHEDAPASVMGGAGQAGSGSSQRCRAGGAEDEESGQSFHQFQCRYSFRKKSRGLSRARGTMAGQRAYPKPRGRQDKRRARVEPHLQATGGHNKISVALRSLQDYRPPFPNVEQIETDRCPLEPVRQICRSIFGIVPTFFSAGHHATDGGGWREPNGDRS
jgi:hypothetical protein